VYIVSWEYNWQQSYSFAVWYSRTLSEPIKINYSFCLPHCKLISFNIFLGLDRTGFGNLEPEGYHALSLPE
jgi:hypothetical protein